MNHLNDFDNEELLIEFAKLHRKDALQQVHNVPFTREDSELCMQIRDELLRRMTAAAESHCRMGVACPQHDGQVHGQEASELRTKLEEYVGRIDVIENGSDVVNELQRILDSTDARDSLAFEEQASPVTEQPKKD